MNAFYVVTILLLYPTYLVLLLFAYTIQPVQKNVISSPLRARVQLCSSTQSIILLIVIFKDQVWSEMMQE